MLNTTGTINMKDMQYMNIFRKITGVDTNYCFEYNNIIFFCVPKKFLRKSVGEDSKNLKKLNQIIGKRVRVISNPKEIKDAKEFIKRIIDPIEINELKINDKEIILNPEKKDKAMLFGRNKKRFFEMKEIIKKFFNKDFKIE